MSTSFFLVCHETKKAIHIASDGFSGWSFYSGEPECMNALRDFMEEHRRKQLEFMDEGRFFDLDGYLEYEWSAKG